MNGKRNNVTVGYIARNQVPMVITFNESDVNFVCTVLGESLERAYNILEMFSYREEEEEQW